MKKCMLLLILGLASYATFISLKQNDFESESYDVRIINGFSNNSSLPLIIWCESEYGGDIGGRALQERDDFSWSVKSGLWKTPLFFCTIKWDGKRKKFEAFRETRDRYRCEKYRQCFWLVKEDGFYFSSDEIAWRKDFSWT
ncbi:S-protein homolog 5 [Olea europaea var. sylvestris]|uniref:S-protein homolog n=1 Tax=Olea europaea subsp. europaea TaxID=158383 RepID=A0A8S0TJE8_OLEEU|nr:S-protein homolog 5 [Olea europaea var. sylvestris]CAA3006070.1 S- homolog 5 [Olea europaea subsp. europaea]